MGCAKFVLLLLAVCACDAVSSGNGGACVEIAFVPGSKEGSDQVIAMRDSKNPDGPVLIDNERCIGCRFCIAACPYSARIFHWFDPRDAEKYKDQPYNVELNVPQKRGTVTKCLMSSDRLREGKLPYCVSACPNGVYWFGDEMEDAVTNGTTKETTQLSALLRDNGAYRLMEELGQNPRVYYLPPKNRLFKFEAGSQEEHKG